MCGLCRGVTNGYSQKMRPRRVVESSEESGSDKPGCQDMSLGAEELH
jgi:hypothetical protein